MSFPCVCSSQMALVILVSKQSVSKDVKSSTMWLSASAQLDTNSTPTEDRALTKTSASTTTDTASTYATTTLVLTLVLAIQATIWCQTVTLACPPIHVPLTMAAVTTSVPSTVSLACVAVDQATSLPPMVHRATWLIHVPWTMVDANISVLSLVILEYVAANLAISYHPLTERRVLISTSVLAMVVRVTVSMLAWTPMAQEFAAAQLAISFFQMEYLVEVSILIEL